MNKFAYRFKFYLIGFGFGCIMVWALFYKNTDRRLSTPEGKIFDFIENVEEIKITDNAKCELYCYSIDTGFINKEFLKNADVIFSESATRRKPCPEYVIKSTLANKKIVKIFIETCLNSCTDCDYEGTATLRSVKVIDDKELCDC